MADESKPPEKSESSEDPQPASSAPPQKSVPVSATPPAAKPAAPPAAKPPAPAPKAPPVAQTPLDNDLVRRYRERFGAAIIDALEDRKQPYLVIDAAQF